MTRIKVKPSEAKKELAARELARRRLMDYCEYVLPWYHGAKHQRLAAQYLEQVELFIRTKGKEGIGRLMLFWPPRTGKTQLVTKNFPSWLLGRLPDTRIILSSYNAERATEASRAAREIVNSERYQAIFGNLGSVDVPVMLSNDSRSITAWDLAAPHRGGVIAAGVGGGLTGAGAHLLIIDDPFKNREEAESESHRNMVYDWFRSSAYTRLEDGGAIVMMNTRWHVDDLSGKLLKLMAVDPLADRYEILMMPAIAEEIRVDEKGDEDWLSEGLAPVEKDILGRKPGEALWREKYDEEDYERIRANIGPYEWAALYQQMPYSRTGEFFKRDWFILSEELPKADEIVQRVRYWDKAGKGEGGDYTAGVLMAIDQSGVYWVEHVAREQISAALRDDFIVETAKVDQIRPGPEVIVWHQQDPGSAGLDSAMLTNQRLAEAGIHAKYEPVSGSKEVRAGPWASMLAAGMVRIVRGGWNQEFIEEHTAFPKGRYDDQVDAASGAFGKLLVGTGVGIYL